jgi:phosphate-selective porin OprO and OprP
LGAIMGVKRVILSGASLAALVMMPAPAHAQASSDPDKIDRLQRQVEQLQEQLKARTQQLDEQLKLMKSELAQAKRKAPQTEALQGAYDAATTKPIAKAAAVPPPAPTAIVKMSPNNRPSICTADGQNCIGLTSRVYFDAGGYSYHPNSPATTVRDLNDGVNVRSARFGVLGTFLSDWNYGLIYEFGGASDGFGNQASGPNASGSSSGPLPGGRRTGIDNAYLQFTGFKGDGISSVQELGYINVPYTMYQNTSLNDILFMERASAQVTAVEIAAGDFRSAGGTGSIRIAFGRAPMRRARNQVLFTTCRAPRR